MNPVPDLNLPIASDTALMIGMLGRALIWSGAALFLLAFFQSLFAPKLSKWGGISFVVGCVSIFGAFITLGGLFLQNQFEFLYVYEHSEKANATAYKIAAIWSGQQGSFLLWATTSAIFALLTLRATGSYRRWYTATYALFLGALCGILSYESPFGLQLFHGKAYIPPDGAGLTASLNNYWVVIHPPTIFLGFGSLTVLFAYALSALISRNYVDWSRLVRPWVLVSLSLVGLGLCMGAFWAYETLGWGGFWKWDPVENVSFVPWCFTAALIHGLLVQGTKGKWQLANLFMAGLPFLFFIYGTFLTRAGFLDALSVHSFAQMEHTAHMVLLVLVLSATAGFIGLWIYRWLHEPKAAPEPKLPGTDRMAWYKFGNIFLALIGTATAMGMSVPLVMYAMHQKPKIVEEHLYHVVLAWFFIPVLLMMAIGPFVSWRKMSLRELGARILNVFSLTIGALGVVMLVMNNPSIGVHAHADDKISFFSGIEVPAMPWIMTLVGVCLFAGVANLWRVVELWKRSRPSAGAFIAHIGVATAMAGLIISRGMERQQTYYLQEGSLAMSLDGGALPYTMTLREVDETKMLDKDNKLSIEVVGDGGSYIAQPGFYYFRGNDGEPVPMRWPSIHRELSHDSYLALQPRQIEAADPASIAPGETKTFKVPDWQRMKELSYKITYVKMEREGAVGTAGTQFKALLKVQTPDGRTVESSPAMAIAKGGGPQMMPAQIDNDFFVSLMRMDAATKSVMLQMNYMRPVYPVELFYKPMTMLVWLGTGILTFGGFLSAWYRRKVLTAVEDSEIAKADPTAEPHNNALVPVA
jgi:cytochrome c-type biogenesis protein CcmF